MQGIDPAEIIATFHALRASVILASSGFCDGGAVNEGTFRITRGRGTQRDDHVKVAILVGSLLAASVARLLLRSRNRIDDRVLDSVLDSDLDSVPDVYTTRAYLRVVQHPGAPSTWAVNGDRRPEANDFTRKCVLCSENER